MSGNKKRVNRFKRNIDPLLEKFNASISFDRKLYKHDIKGSKAHVRMLGDCGIVKKKESKAIISALEKVEAEINTGKLKLNVSDEDIHMAIEKRLSEITGPTVGGKMHTARSRNDQVATALRLYVRDKIDEINNLILNFQKVIVRRARENVDTAAPAYTHMQPAQPIRLAHWFLAWFEMFERDISRFKDARKRVNVLPLGSAAMAGTNFSINRKQVAKELGFDSISENSMDAVSDRDFAVEFTFCVSMTATHLSRLAEELVIFSSSEFGHMRLPEPLTTGSSIMPQKKNPDGAELIRGKTGRLYVGLVSLLTMLKGLPLTYNKDLQEDKEPVFDASEQITLMIRIMTKMIDELSLNVELLSASSEKGFMTAVDIADSLVMMGLPFREAHGVVSKLVKHCSENSLQFTGADETTLSGIHPSLPQAVRYFTALDSADGKDVYGGTARKRIITRIKAIERKLNK